ELRILLFPQIEEDEMQRPIARKVLADRHIYYSRPMPISTGLPVLSDLGEARVGNYKHRGDIMPGIYRVPEVILDMQWNCKVDIWSVGTMTQSWDLAESSHLLYAKKDYILSDEQHLAEMVSLHPEFLRRSEKALQYWDNKGISFTCYLCNLWILIWYSSYRETGKKSLEIRERQFWGENKELFLTFLRRIFRWLPEERPTAEELVYDGFLMQPLFQARSTA
ncbi:kinase domain-containing protein, partial [Penicillium alfredii]